MEVLSYLGAVILGVAVVWSFVVMINGPGVLKGINHRCDVDSQACGTVVGFLIPLLSVALASAVFLFLRLRYIRSPVAKEAKIKPQDLVETATPNMECIVGRDELCQVIMEDIRHRDIRRPHLVVGGVGTGKTAVLVRLTQLLANRRAIPVPVRLRDAQDALNFRDLAYKRFLAMTTERRLLSEGEAEKAWRQLSRDDKIVIVADGLEEALSEGSAQQDRDNLIRLAIHRARRLRIPLIIASRPHEPLRGVDATIMELEPLSEEAALEYIDPDGDSGDARRLSWIVETAGLAELPLYLQITRQLADHNRLDHLAGDGAPMKVDTRTRDRDRSELRLRLLDTWMEALFDGHLMAAVSLNRDEREAAVEWLSALACIGLKADTIDLKFDDYYTGKSSDKTSAAQTPRYEAMDKEIQCRLKEKLPRRHLDIRLAVSWGDRLGLVEAHGDGLRFPHSIMQAYLGSRFMQTALEDPKFQKDVKAALEKPGRELLIALVLYSRSKADRKGPARPALVAASAEPPLAIAAAGSPAAATPAVAAAPTTTTTAVVAATAGAGTATAALTPNTTAAAPPSEEGQPTESGQVTVPAGTATPPPATPKGVCSDVRSIRNILTRSAGKAQDDVKKLDLYAAALEIDSFLDESRHDFIAHCVGTRWGYIRGGDQRTLDEAKLGLVYRFGDAARAIARRRDRGEDLPEPAYGELLEMGCAESSYPIRLAIAGEIGRGGDPAFRVLHKRPGDKSAAPWTAAAWPGKSANGKKDKKLSANGRNEHKEPDQAIQQADDRKRILQGRTLCAWLAPQLVGSVRDCSEEAQEELARWLGRVGQTAPGRGKGYFPISLEIALAQGFKCAANRRGPHRHGLSETGFYLSEHALEMLQEARFWFSQLTLIQALCLWELQKPGVRRDDNARTRPNGEPRGRNRGHQPGSDPEATVRRWLEVAGNREHPFVKEAGQLAVLALKTGHPERFLWMDESGVVSNVGSRATRVTNGRTPRVWIPPSSGWAALDPRAQQLVADVLLVLNLAERGQQSERIERRLKRVGGNDLPPCLTKNRDPLDPRRTVGGHDTEPGNNCLDGCPFGLCPYPPNGLQPYRSELSEAFCRGQQTLLSKGLTAPWQTILRADLKRFWAGMAKRARGESSAKDAARS